MSVLGKIRRALTQKTAPVTSNNAPKPESEKPAAAKPKVFHSARASRPIGLFYDELSRGTNPFSFIQTAGVADASDPPEHIAKLFDTYGCVKIRGVYSAERSRDLNTICVEHSGLEWDDYHAVIKKEKKMGTCRGAALREKRLWSYSTDPTIVKIITAIQGKDSFEYGTSIAAHYTARGIHRDYRMLCENDDSIYSIKNPQKRIARILHYCGISGGALGYIPFSYDEKKFNDVAASLGIPHDTAWFDRHREVLTAARKQKRFHDADEIERHVCWVYADPGDIILSNSAILHCGEYLTGPRYFFVSTYASSDPETLKLGAAHARDSLLEEYLAYQATQGLEGASKVLTALKSKPLPATAPAPADA